MEEDDKGDLSNNLFSEEFARVSKGKESITLTDVLKISILDDNGDYKINLCHIPTLFFLDADKDGKFTLSDFAKLSKISEDKEKEYKRFEFSSQLQAYFTLLMWKAVCSEEGEKDFVDWVKKLIIKTENNDLNKTESDDDSVNPDPNKYIDRSCLRTLYDVLNVKNTHGIDFQSFFELMKITSDDLEEEGNTNENEEFVLIAVLDFFCLHFIRGFTKLSIDLGFDSFMENEYDIHQR